MKTTHPARQPVTQLPEQLTVKTFRIATLFLLTLGLSNISYAIEQGVTDDTITLGVISPLSGPASLIGKAHNLGVRIWNADVNERGGINGRTIKVKYEDDGYVPARTLQSLKKLTDLDNIFGLVGTSGSAHLKAMLPVLDRENIPAINAIAVNSAHFNPVHNSVFVIGPTYCQEIHAALGKLVEMKSLQKAKFGLIYQDDDYGTDVRCGYLKAIEEYGLNNVIELKYHRGQKNFSSEVLKLRRAGVTTLLAGGIVSETAAMLKESYRNRMNLTILTTHASHLLAVQKLAGKAGDGYFIADYMPPLSNTDIPGMKRFIALAKKHLSETEFKSISRYSTSSYIGALAMEEGIKQCGKNVTRKCVIDKLENLKDFETEGLMGPISFGPGNRQSATSAVIIRSNAKTQSFEKVSNYIPIQ
ncbi:MAG: ABC transporter substrate-binding protein [Pseudomonadales bacterium]|nr:ABC transporter substrate-binding protein [Pseudomonadales bacterium]